jgi:hypothetical protein
MLLRAPMQFSGFNRSSPIKSLFAWGTSGLGSKASQVFRAFSRRVDRMQALGDIRVSTDMQTGEGASLAAQKARL